jgi:hypothetical protein
LQIVNVTKQKEVRTYIYNNPRNRKEVRTYIYISDRRFEKAGTGTRYRYRPPSSGTGIGIGIFRYYTGILKSGSRRYSVFF